MRLPDKVFRWITASKIEVPPDVRLVLLEELLASPSAVAMAMLNGLIINSIFLYLHYSPVFIVLAMIEVACGIGRSAAIWQILRNRSAGMRPPIGPTVWLGFVWCCLQGCTAFVGTSSGDPTLEVLSATLSMTLIGPICAVNYPAPRLAFLFICVCALPFVAAACLSGYRTGWILLLLTPAFLYSAWQIVGRFHSVSVQALLGARASEHLARHDPLTGLSNRLVFEETMQRRSEAGEAAFALLCLDLDGFKAVNDTFGHHAGDALLQGVARRLEACMRPDDVIIRLGGDEFVIVADQLETAALSELACRIEEAVAGRPFFFETLPPIRVGVSVGFACAPRDGRDTAALYRTADHNLYARKTEGKRRRAADTTIVALHAYSGGSR